jgi:hypothetical protein
MKLSRMMTGLLAVALMSFMVSDVMAQGRRPGGGQPGGGGQGGFGQRGPGGGGFGGRGGPGGGGGSGPEAMLGLLRVEEVKVEVELSPEQDEAIGKLTPERPNFENFRDMSEDERRAAFSKMQKGREERAKKLPEQLEQVLLPQQMDRLKQIQLQLRGIRALREEEVVKELKITAAQTKEIEGVEEKLREENGPKFRELMASGDREAMQEAFTKVRAESEKQVLAVLTSDQKKQFEEMKGEKFEMPEGAFGGGRGGPGGGFAGRGGRGGDAGGRGGDGGRGRGGDGGGRRGRPAVEE